MSPAALRHRDIGEFCTMCRIALVVIFMALGSFLASANEQQTMLIINSYNESTPWSQSFAQPINIKLTEYKDVHLEMINLNSANIKNQEQYDDVVDRIFDIFADNKPNYVVMIGNFAFTVRDRIKQEWGDIPMLLISRIDRYAPLSYYYSGYTGDRDWSKLPEISDIRYDYNMTMILTPDFCDENVELMNQVIPNLKKIVFISDDVYPNRSFDLRLSNYLKKAHPDIEYEWLQAGDSTVQEFQNYMLNKHENTGFLISTWVNVDHDDDMLGINAGNLHMVSSAANPVFSLRDSYLSIGSLGGVYHDLNKGADALSEAIDNMLQGKDMRTTPMYILDQGVPVINHQRMQGLGYKESDFPENTRYIFRTPTLWEAHQGKIIAYAILLLLIIVAVIVFMSIQGKRINLLKTHALFIKNMPWAYSKAKILYNAKGEIYDIEYDLEHMNSAFLQLISDNLLPNTRYTIFPSDFISAKVKDVITSGESKTFTYHFERTNTYYEIMLCRINPEKQKPGEKPKDIDIFANNITKRISAQNKLRRTMQTLDITLNVARLMPWQWDVQKGRVYYDGFRALRDIDKDIDDYEPLKMRYRIDEIDFLGTIHIEDRARIGQLLDDVHEGRRTHVRTEFKVQMERNNRMRIDWVEINATVTQQDAKGKPKTVLGSLLVINDRKKQEIALIQAKEKASESDRMKSAFLANMSHEIRTPLNAIVGFSSLITQTDDPAERARYTAIIEHNNDLLLHLINDVLDIAKIESNTMQLQIIDTDLNDLMRSLYDTVKQRISGDVEFNMALGAEECNFRTDPNRLSQVLINLLSNSAKFTTQGSITYGYAIKGQDIEFFVSDTGLGISQENQTKLFQRFSKLNNFVQGSGLGLAICKSFIEKMGGTIGVRSGGEGNGATFWFTLPYTKVEKGKSLEMTEAKVIEDPQQESQDITVLVAEDNESNYALFESILSKHYKLLRAHNGREAIRLYLKNKPQIILMDIRMPDMDGFEATKEIRKHSQTVPIIAVTAHAFQSEKDKIKKSGFNGYIPKPINPKDLLDIIKAQLGKRFYEF